MSSKPITKEAALKVSRLLDQAATTFQKHHVALGIKPKIANDFALRCDILSDHVEKQAGIDRRAQMDPKENYTEDALGPDDFDPAEIGEQTPGALLRNEDEPYMDTFNQQWFDQLREVQQTGQFSNAKTAAQLIKHMAGLLHAHGIPLVVRRKKSPKVA
jgi:hypothetical protein